MIALRPIIQFIPSVNTSQRNRPAARRFLCPYINCNQSFHLYRHYSSHIELEHECKCCGLPFENLVHHYCDYVQQEEGGQSLPHYIEVGIFKYEVFHRSALTRFYHILTTFHETFEKAFDFVNNDLENLLTQLLHYHRGLKVSISLSTLLDRATDSYRLDRKCI